MKPAGSGFYAIAVATLFVVGFVVSFFLAISQDKQFNLWLIRAWSLFVALSLGYWGVDRTRSGNRNDMTVGQDTINMVNGIFGSTIALLALMFGK